MSGNRRAVALQGVGCGRRLLAFQGLRGVDDTPPTQAGGGWLTRVPRKRAKKRRLDEELFLLLAQ